MLAEGMIGSLILSNPWVIASGVLFFIVVFMVCCRYLLKHKIKQKFNQLRDRGCPLTFEELDSFLKLPDGIPNAADQYIKAIESFNEPTEEEIPNLLILGDAESPEAGQAYPTEQIQAAKAFLQKNRQCLNFLYEATQIKECYFERDYLNFELVSCVEGRRQLASLLALDALVCIVEREPDKVIKAVNALLQFAKCISEPYLIDYLMAAAIQKMAIGVFREGANCNLFSDVQLEEVASILKRYRQSNDFCRILTAERCFSIISVLHPEKTGYAKGFLSKIQCVCQRALGLLDWNLLAILKVYDSLFEAYNVPYQEQFSKRQQLLQSQLEALSFLSYKAKELACVYLEQDVALGGVFKLKLKYSTVSIWFECQSAFDAAMTACAIERYQISHEGQLPQSLDELVPQYLDQLEYDPFDGRFLKYKITPEGYVIYTTWDEQWNEERETEQAEGRYAFEMSRFNNSQRSVS